MSCSGHLNPCALLLRGSAVLVLAISAGLAGCTQARVDDNLFETNGPSEVGATEFAVTSVTPWAEVESDLQPNFSLDEDTALNLVMPVAGYGVQNDTDTNRLALNVSGGYGGGRAAKPEAPSSPANYGGNAKTGSQNNGGPKGGQSGQLLTPFSGDPFMPPGGQLQIDPQLRYALATSLLQYVRLTNHYVHDLVDQQGARAYVVRVQITLMPLSREAQYDAYTDIAFFGEDSTGITSIQAVPLLETDALEGLVQTNSSTKIRDLALSLEATFASAGGGIDAEKLTQTLNALAGEDKNSLLTMGRVTDNTVRVRMGAMAQPTGEYVMVPRTCTVPVVLLVRGQKPGTKPMMVHAVSKTVFVNSITGKLLRGRAKWESLIEMPPIRDSYHILKPVYQKDLAKLTGYAAMGDVADFARTVRADLLAANPGMAATKPPPDSGAAQARMSADMANISELWMEAVSLRATDAVQMLQFALPPTAQPRLPPADQTATLFDDGTNSIVLLHGGLLLNQLALQGTLDVNPAAKGLKSADAMHLYAATELTSPDAHDVEFWFPSLKAAGLTLSPGPINPQEAGLSVTSSNMDDATATPAQTNATPYNLVLLSANPLPQAPAATQPASPEVGHLLWLDPGTQIEPDESDQASVSLQLKSIAGTAGPYYLAVSNAEIAATPPGGMLENENGKWAIKHYGTIHLKLQKFAKSPVTFSIVDSNGQTIEGIIRAVDIKTKAQSQSSKTPRGSPPGHN